MSARAAYGSKLGPELKPEWCRRFTEQEAETLARILFRGWKNLAGRWRRPAAPRPIPEGEAD